MDDHNVLRAENISGETVIIANTIIAKEGIHLHARGAAPPSEDLPTLILSAFARPVPTDLPAPPQYPSPTWASYSEYTLLPLFYESHRKGLQIDITNVNPYVDAVRNGRPLHTLSTSNPWYDVFHFPTFDVKLVNNTAKTVFFHEAEFRVAKSTPDTSVIPAVLGLLGSLYVRIANLGWGEMRNASMRFALTAIPEDCLEQAPLDLPNELPHVISLGDITPAKTFTLLPFFQIEGIDTNRLADLLDTHWDTNETTVHLRKEMEFCYPSSEPDGEDDYVQTRELPRPDYERFLKAVAGRFYNARPCLAGILEYDEALSEGAIERRAVPIFALLDFQRHGLGAGAPPSNSYHIQLDVEGENYVRTLPISHALKAGEIDRFLIQVSAARSSSHELTFSLRFNNDQVVEAPVHLELFCTRMDSPYATRTDFVQS